MDVVTTIFYYVDRGKSIGLIEQTHTMDDTSRPKRVLESIQPAKRNVGRPRRNWGSDTERQYNLEDFKRF